MAFRLKYLGVAAAAALFAFAVPSAIGGHAVEGVDVKVTDDNNNVDGGLANTTPSKDARNRQSNETTVSISTVPSPVTGLRGDIVATAANDYRMVPHFGDAWLGFYLSFDGGSTWFGPPPLPHGFNTMVPGFPTDTSPAGIASPLKNLDGSGDPVVRFDAHGNLFVAGIAFNRNFDQPDRPVDTVVYVAKYRFTPGTPATASTPNRAGTPPHFTYAGTKVVVRGAVGFAVPSPFGFAGRFVDKEWMEIDTNSPAQSPCAGNIYVTWSDFRGLSGSTPIKFSRSTDGGATFSQGQVISTGGTGTTQNNQGSDIAVAPNGTIYVAYRTFSRSTGLSTVSIVKSTNCGRSWSQPIRVGSITAGQAPGINFRTPTFAFVATDSSNSNIVYVAYQHLSGDYDVYVQRSTNGGTTWGPRVQVNTDPGAHQQVFPMIEVSHGAVHVAWYDTRNSAPGKNDMVDVYYACSNCAGSVYPAFSHEVRVTDVSHNGNCLLFGGGTAGFHGDYNELDAFWTGANHKVNVAWADHRDVNPCDLDPAPGPPSNNTGNRNENIYADTLTVSP
jgi:hypothetical protein